MRRTVASASDFGALSFSPRGDRLAYARTVGRQGSDIYTAGVGGGRPVALTHDHNSLAPVWGPRWIVFSRSRPSARRLGIPALGLIGEGLSRDGTTVLATTGGPDPNDSDVIAVPYTGGRLHTLAAHARMPSWNAARAPR